MSNIQEPLKKIFDRHRIVFWYDTDKELRADYEALDLPDVIKVELTTRMLNSFIQKLTAQLKKSMSILDLVTLEVFKHLILAIPEEMGANLRRTAFSPNIKERLDESCAVFDAKSRLIAQAEHIPVHLGAMPSAVEAVAVDFPEMSPGDQVIVNDPYRGGSHLPDITLIAPFFWKGKLKGYAVNRAHHADMGGDTPGSMPGSSSSDTYDQHGKHSG